MSTGVGGGKTWFLAAAATLLAYAAPAGAVGLFGAPTYPMLRDVDMRACEAFWLEHGIPFVAHRSEHAFTFPEPGNDLLFRSLEHPDRVRGINASYELGDEVQGWDEYAFNVFIGRLRVPNEFQCFLGAGTPNGFNWSYEKFGEAGGAHLLDNAELVHGTSIDNHHNGKDYVSSLATSYDPELYKQEVLGEFIAIGQAQTYYAFSRENLRAFAVEESLPLSLDCDFNIDGTWVVTQGLGTVEHPLRAIDEISFSGGGSTTIACREFLSRYRHHPTGFEVYADRSGEARKTVGQSDFEEIQTHLGVYPRARYGSNPRVIDRVAATNALLLNAKGQRRFFVDPQKCPRLANDLQKVKNLPGTREIDKSDARLTHASDAVGYEIAYRWPVVAERTGAPQRRAA